MWNKRLAIASFLVLLVGIWVWWLSPEPPGAALRPPADPRPAVVPLPNLKVHEAALGRGGSLYETLLGAGLTPQATEPITRALGDVLELRKLRPSDHVRVEFDTAGAARRVEVVRGPAERYEARLGDGAPAARKIDVPVEARWRRLAGSVETSLYDAILAAGGDADVVVRLADLFAWDIDFFTDPRPGDHFDVLFEESYLDGRKIGGGPIIWARYEGARAGGEAMRFETAAGPGYFGRQGKSVRKSLLKSPLNYRRISSTFSLRRRHPITKRYRPHLGVDFAAPTGTPVVAVGEGAVEFAAYKGANGKLVILNHPNGYKTYYLHLSRFGKGIRRGAKVHQGQVIGYVGSTGMSTGPHLDFRVKKGRRFVNPLKLTLPPGPPIPALERAAFDAQWAWLEAAVPACPLGGAMSIAQVERLGSHLLQVAEASGKAGPLTAAQ